MTAFGDGYVVAWYDDRDGNAEIYFRLLSPAGKPAGIERRLTNDPESSYEADIQAIGRDLLVAWYERTASGELRALFGRWSSAGEPRWSKSLSPSGRSGRNPVVRQAGTELFTAWVEDSGETAAIFGQWWSVEGAPLSDPQRLADASRNTWNLNARVDGEGRVWLAFDAHASTKASEIFLMGITRSEASLLRLTPDDGFASKYPDLAFNGNRVALTWFDERDGNSEVYLFTGTSAELREEVQSRARRITETPGESMGAYVASGPPGFGLAWCDNTSGQHEIYFQPFDEFGIPLKEPRRVTHTKTESLVPAISVAPEGFALAWNEYMPQGPGHTRGARSEIAFARVR